ncbi:MAG: 5'-nucleotidase C-terminal domain-containing protein [Bacteroidetes bacterium]|nr:5'-nucleotidase C-terminal domain-containing protein [Bacteroidota bacterium]
MNRAFFSIKKILFFAALLLLSCKHWQSTQTQAQHLVASEAGIDSNVVKTIAPYKQNLDVKMHEIIGMAPAALVKKLPESTLGNFFADAIFEKVKNTAGIDTAYAFALFNTGGLRASVPEGNVTVGTMYELMPFENKLVVLKINAQRLQKLLNFVATKHGAPVAGIRFAIDDEKASDIWIQGKPINSEKNYYVATSDYLAHGGDHFFEAEEVFETAETNMLLRDVLIEYCKNKNKQNQPLTATLDARIHYTK